MFTKYTGQVADEKVRHEMTGLIKTNRIEELVNLEQSLNFHVYINIMKRNLNHRVANTFQDEQVSIIFQQDGIPAHEAGEYIVSGSPFAFTKQGQCIPNKSPDFMGITRVFIMNRVCEIF